MIVWVCTQSLSQYFEEEIYLTVILQSQRQTYRRKNYTMPNDQNTGRFGIDLHDDYTVWLMQYRNSIARWIVGSRGKTITLKNTLHSKCLLDRTAKCFHKCDLCILRNVKQYQHKIWTQFHYTSQDDNGWIYDIGERTGNRTILRESVFFTFIAEMLQNKFYFFFIT